VLIRFLLAVGWLIAVPLAWAAAIWLIVARNVGTISDFWAPIRLLTAAAFLAAPALTFLPLERVTRVPFLSIEAIAGWSTTLFVWTFVDPSRLRSPLAILILLLPLLVAVSTLFTVLSAALEHRWATRSGKEIRSPARPATRLCPGALRRRCLLLHSLEALTLINAGMLGVIALLAEVMAMTWFAPFEKRGHDTVARLGHRRRWNEYRRGPFGPR
jgi:hypothetical protein